MKHPPQKILIIQTASIGDVILSTSLAESLKKRIPDASIHYLVKAGHEKLFQGHPFVSQVFGWEKKRAKYRHLFGLIRQVQRRQYDLIVNVQRFFSSGLITVLGNARQSSGFQKNPLSFFFKYTYPHEIAKTIGSPHETERNHQLISFIDGIEPSLPKLYPTNADYEFVRGYRMLPYITISPASLWFTKQYPEDKWVAFLGHVPKHFNIFLLGAPNDLALCRRIASASGMPNVYVLAGQLSFLQSAALMKHARMNYTNDSAPLHLASAVNAPVTAIFCSTVPEFGFGPLSEISHIVQHPQKLNCRPCGLHGHKKCPEGHFNCAREIAVSQLLSTL